MSNEATARPGDAGAGFPAVARSDVGAGRRVDPFALMLVILLFVEHLIFGANRGDLALAFAVPHFLLLLSLLAASKGAEPPRFPLLWPAVLLEVVFALGLFSLLPVGPPLA